MNRHWFLTWTIYGTWLPGDAHGFTGKTKDVPRHAFADPLAPPNAPNERLAAYSLNSLKAPSVYFQQPHAEALFSQFQETASHRHWRLLAVGIMTTHVHLVVGVDDDPDPEKLLGDFKSYGSRRLNRDFGRPKNDTWWTEGGSKQKLKNHAEVEATIDYIRRQPNPLLIWTIDGAETSKLVVNDRSGTIERRTFYKPVNKNDSRLAGDVSPPVATNASFASSPKTVSITPPVQLATNRGANAPR